LTSLIRSPKDFWAGVIYVAFGLIAVTLARDYGMGTALRMGAGYFPTVLGGLLTLIGIISLVRSFAQGGGRIGGFPFKALSLVIVATLIFGYTVRGAGLAVALPVFVVMSAYASIHFRWSSTLAVAAGLTVFCVLVFLIALGVPLPIFGPWFGR
jgi:putative tricarboxylic transport membrane protein